MLLVLFRLTFITGLPLNLLAFCVFMVKARRRLLPADVLLLNLTVSDLVLLAFLPIRIAEASWEMKWKMPDFLCPFSGLLFFSSIYLTTLSLTGFSVDHYLSVAFPLRYKARRRPPYAMVAVALFWVTAFFHCSVIYVVQYQARGNDTAGNLTSTRADRWDGTTHPGVSSSGVAVLQGDRPGPQRSAQSSPRSCRNGIATGEFPSAWRSTWLSSSGNCSIYISSLFLMAVSVDRYLGVAFPIKYKLRRHPAYAIATSVVFWVVTCAHCSIVYIVQYEVLSPNGTATSNNMSHCYEDFSSTQLQILLPVRLEFFIFLVLFCLPFTVTIFCYVNFVRILMALPNIPARRKQRAVGLAVATLFNFIVCFAPYNLSHVVGFVQNKSPSWRVYALLLSTLNAALDPAIFYFSSTAVQRAFTKCLAGLWHKLSPFMARCHLPYLTCSGEGGREGEADSGDEAEGSMT
uniref:G-protein coupled receptors family 1 profile domain-containing protein n=1 Tax=Gopherus evgoodei TaxID=1825980 RepID=A0A8C4WRG1_9SAUR